MMIFSLVAMIGLDKCCITSACLQWLCHSCERIVARGPLVEVVVMSLAQNVCLDDFRVKFETGLLGVRNYVTRPNQRTTL